jgi:hypothetical protein
VGVLGGQVRKVTLVARDREVAPKTLGFIRAQPGLDRESFEKFIGEDNR